MGNIDVKVIDSSKGVPQQDVLNNEQVEELASEMTVHPDGSWERETSPPTEEDRIKPTTSGFVTKDSGQRVEFDTGSVRDTQDGKPRYDLIPTLPLERLASLYARGAEKYGDNNWKKGQPFSRLYASLYRHLIAWRNGEEDEDHMAAVVWNAFAIMHFEEVMPDLDDLDA